MENQWSWLKWAVVIAVTLWVTTLLKPQVTNWVNQTDANPTRSEEAAEDGAETIK